ncbi:MAG: hypothetical protein EOO42_12730 [Flavobacteriales bacterium]|nr:MAG: hypothetical protein EOO42_12730 [Flavobacteriales bacterium]
MPQLSFKKPTEIKFKVTAYNNCDDVQLFWRTLDLSQKDSPIENCIGFAVQRQRLKEGKWSRPEILRNRVGYTDGPVVTNNITEISKPSNVWAFQRYDWTDHGANYGETVRYKVLAVKQDPTKVLGVDELTVLLESEWTKAIAVDEKAGDGLSVYFNRGTVMSQYVARIAREKNWTHQQLKQNIKEVKEPLRIFLAGELRLAMLRLLDEVIANPFLNVNCALYELSDSELIDKLKLIGKRAHVILSDGSNSHVLPDGSTEYIDGNKLSRATLNKAKVNVYDRILASKGLGHNKILIVVDNRTDRARTVWTGSTNWSSSGLCTQLNNGIQIDHPEAVNHYYEYWKVVKAAGSNFTPELVAYNGAGAKVADNINIWFTRAAKPVPVNTMPIDLATIKQLVDKAQQTILYVMFQPGPEPLSSILQKRANPAIYIRGVVSTVIPGNKEKFTLMDESLDQPYTTDLIQPDGIKDDFGWWIKEITRKQFIPQIGYAITHTKMIVIDPFSENPTVITGSHNFSRSASQENDENFVIINGNKKLAEHYAVTCLAMYAHYRWRAYVYSKAQSGQSVWSHLKQTADWQISYLSSKRLITHLNEWC